LVQPESRRNEHCSGKNGFATSISAPFWTLAMHEMNITVAKVVRDFNKWGVAPFRPN
jgi:hypothetical protein